MDVDGQLLDRYARTRDADAFMQLVRRHSGMVFAAAHRVTHNHHDAQEVAQCCFMELARRPAAIHGSLAGWLHTVATTRAASFNRAAATRSRHERAAARPEALPDSPWDEVSPLVDAALAELPKNLRLPLILYYLQGQTQAQVGAELDLNQGTVSRCLEAGVAALREKLREAGVMAPSVALPALLAAHALEAAPGSLMAELGKLAVSGVVPATTGPAAGGSSSGTVVSSSASVATKVAIPLAAKIAAALAIAAAVSTTGYLELRTPTQPAAAISLGQVNEITSNGTELNNLIDRLQTEDDQGLGDGVLIVTFTRIDTKNPQLSTPKPEALNLYAQQGASRLKIYINGLANPKGTWPEGWPRPGLDETLRFVAQHRTGSLQVTDGHTWWRTPFHNPKSLLLSSRVNQNGQVHPDISAGINYQASISSPATSANWGVVAGNVGVVDGDHLSPAGAWVGGNEVVRSPQNPSLVGLRSTWRLLPGKHEAFGRFSSAEATYWLDPSRNDVPVEIDAIWTPVNKLWPGHDKYQYLEYVQLPNGLWYATHYQCLSNGGCIDYQATFFPGERLDARWFGNPAIHFAGKNGMVVVEAASNSVATAVGTITNAVPKAIAATAVTVGRSAWQWWPWALAAGVFGAAGVLYIRQRRGPSQSPALRGFQGPRRR